MKYITCFALAVAAAFFLGAQSAPRKSAVDRSKVVDLSYTYDQNTLYWPTSPPFSWKKDAWGKSAAGYWYSSATLTTSEHGGTHLDSPIHFGEGKWTTAEIPLSRLIGPADVIDVSAACARNRDYLVQLSDIQTWEKAHARIGEGDIVLIRTGWGKHWPNAKAYLGSDKRGTTDGLSFPGVGLEAARALVNRKISGLGIDTASIDFGKSQEYQTHRVLNGANIYALENIANLDKLPSQGATLIALPMKIGGGSGGPTRVIAVFSGS